MSTVTVIGIVLCFIGVVVIGAGMKKNGPTAEVDSYDVLGFGSFCFGVGLLVGLAL